MLYLRTFAPDELADQVVDALLAHAGVRHVVRSGTTADTHAEVLTAEVRPEAADELLAQITRLGVPPHDVSLSRVELAGPVLGDADDDDGASADGDDTLVWAEVTDEALENVGLRPTYLAYMAVAGVIAAFGVIEHSAILIVGAMAVSPDLLPLSAVCVGIVGRRPRLAGRAVATLAPGMTCAVGAALLVTVVLRAVGYVPADLDIAGGVAGRLAAVNLATALVALAAGVAGMLSFETRASFAVGVAISVTTIPAAAYIGVAAGLGEARGALGALTVLLVNLAMLIVSGTLTLWVQRRRTTMGRGTA